MKKRSSAPVPVVDLPREHELAQLAVLVESAMQEPPAGLPQVKWRIRSTVRRHAEWRRRVLRVSLVGALLFLAGGVVGAVIQPVFYPRARSDAPLPADPLASHPRRVHKRTQPPAPADEAPEAVPEIATISAAPATAETSGTTAVTPPLPEAQARAMDTPASRPIARLPSAASTRVRLPPALPRPPKAMPSEDAPQAAASAVAPVAALPAGLPAELPSQPRRPDPRRIALVSPPASPAPSLRTPDPPPQMAPGAATPTPALLAAPPFHKPAEAATATPAPADEQALLGKALQRLRIARDPVGALALLDQHTARFPSGTLAPEAARLRTEALMLVGRKDVVLADLDNQADTLAGSDERRLLRGELRATAGRWRLALADFDAVVHSLAQGTADDVKTRERFERALWGRASARSQLADQAGARADLHDYLRRFPNGRFAAEARRLVNERR
jgi:hypothetical protein